MSEKTDEIRWLTKLRKKVAKLSEKQRPRGEGG